MKRIRSLMNEWPPKAETVGEFKMHICLFLLGSVSLTSFFNKSDDEESKEERRFVRSEAVKTREICTDLIGVVAKSNPELVRDVLTFKTSRSKEHVKYNMNRMKLLSTSPDKTENLLIKAESLVEASMNADNATRLDSESTNEELRVVFVSKLLAAKLLVREMNSETDPDNLEELVDMSVQLCPLLVETYVSYQIYLPRKLTKFLYQCRDDYDFVLYDVMSRAVSRARRLIWISRRERATIALQFGSRVIGWQIPIFALSVILSLGCGLCAASHLRYHSSIASLARQVFDVTKRKQGRKAGQGFFSKASDVISAMILMKVMELTLQLIRNRVNESGQNRLTLRLKRELFAAVLRQDIEWFESGISSSSSSSHRTSNIKSQRAAEAKRLVEMVDTIVPRLLNVPTNTIESLARVVSSAWILYRTSPKMLFLLCFALPAKTCLESFLEHAENAVERTVVVRDNSFYLHSFAHLHTHIYTYT